VSVCDDVRNRSCKDDSGTPNAAADNAPTNAVASASPDRTAGLRPPLLLARGSLADEIAIFAMHKRTCRRAAGVSPACGSGKALATTLPRLSGSVPGKHARRSDSARVRTQSLRRRARAVSARCGYADAIATAFLNTPATISRTVSVMPLQIRFPHHGGLTSAAPDGGRSSSEGAFPRQRDYRAPRRVTPAAPGFATRYSPLARARGSWLRVDRSPMRLRFLRCTNARAQERLVSARRGFRKHACNDATPIVRQRTGQTRSQERFRTRSHTVVAQTSKSGGCQPAVVTRRRLQPRCPNAPEIISRTILVTPLQIRFPHHGVH